MRTTDRLIGLVARRSRAVVAVFLVVTLLLGSGVGAIEQSSSLDQFQTDSDEADKQAYIDEHFGGEENTTTAQLIVREGNALSKELLISTLELQGEFRENETINATLAEEPFGDLSNVVATTAIRQERADELETRSDDLEARGETLEERSERLEAEGEALEVKGEELAERGEAIEDDAAELEADAAELEERLGEFEEEWADLEARGEFMAETLNGTRDLRVAYDREEITEASIAGLDADARQRLPAAEYAAFSPLIDDVADAQAELNSLEAQYRAGGITEAEYEAQSTEPAAEIEGAYDAIEGDVLAPASADLADRGETLEEDAAALEERQERLEERGDALEADREALEDDFEAISEIDPSREEQIAQLESMSQSEINDVLETVLDEDEELAGESDLAIVLSSGEADVRSPLSVMESVAEEDEAFEEAFSDADTTGDGVLDENVEGVYDALFAADAEAAEDVIYRTETGEYESFRLVISIRGSAGTDLATEETRSVAAVLNGDGLEATATGQLIVFGIVEDELLQTVIESMLVTLMAVFAFLMLAYRWAHGSAVLGAVTLLPIVLSVAWILGRCTSWGSRST